MHTTRGVRETMIGGNELLSITGNSSTSAGGTLVIQAGAQASLNAANIVIDAGASLTLMAGGHHLLITAGGIFSSVDIVQGGSPAAGLLPSAAMAGAAQPVIGTVRSIVAAARQHAADFCPLCEACLDGQCSMGATA